MGTTVATRRADVIDRILQTSNWRLGAKGAGAIGMFLRAYFRRIPVNDAANADPESLFGQAYAHWRFAAQRKPGITRLRVYNPSLEEDGWHSEHSVIEVVTDDMPFLVASVIAEINRRDLTVHFVIHPVLSVVRDKDGTLTGLADASSEGATRESFIQLQINRQPDAVLADLTASLKGVFADVRDAVDDWQSMRGRVHAIIDSFSPRLAGASDDSAFAEAIAFLEWISANNFTFLGYREYAIGEGAMVTVVPDSGLGVLRNPSTMVFDDVRDGGPIPAPGLDFIAGPEPLAVAKANRKSTVHRCVFMDTVVVKCFDDQSNVNGAHVIVGLFASSAYTWSARRIPWLRRKVEAVLTRAGFDARGHDGRALVNILETFPRDELFQADADHLLATSLDILDLQIRPRVAVFVRRDDFRRDVACLIYVPRDRYTTELRLEIQGILEHAFGAEVIAHYALVSDQPLARLQVYLRAKAGFSPDVDDTNIRDAILNAIRTWSDKLLRGLLDDRGEEAGHHLFDRYRKAFPPGYRDRFSVAQAVEDIERIECALERDGLELKLYRPFDAADTQVRFKVFHANGPIELSRTLPILESLGVRVIDEMPFRIPLPGDPHNVIIHDFGLESRSSEAVSPQAISESFNGAFLRIWRGEAECDRLNALVLSTGLQWRDIAMLRAYSRYLRQAGVPFTQAYIERAVISYPAITRQLFELFVVLFDPAKDDGREGRADALRASITAALDQVVSADDDRILRRFWNLIEATLRTNFFQTDSNGEPPVCLSVKLDSRRIDELPAPRPLYEIFVYSPRVEGIHLRGGKVARGGIRWSDRREDFRTEILGLMKAQMVKNAVIVPVGAKGGFVVKQPPESPDRDAQQAEGIACYRLFINALLDITDNLAGGNVVPPKQCVRRDDDDPYLVVAADKGTATFSDVANEIACGHGFWLGDAFASGGSQGYDHKAMGITARGAWESVKRHFREMGTDIATTDFTVIGVGDMSGDVFGNGMLLSTHIKLIGAFNHLHIFVDPDPDPERSLAERQRLFALPRSSWRDYDTAALSKGGAIFNRSAKSLSLSLEIRQRLGLTVDRLTPTQLIRALLTAEVDLLWLGGIGTYVKSSDEANSEVGDRANDTIRIDAAELRCRIVGEGANLGFTQLGRIEFARGGGRINTDFIDNSAGVDCSDHEVNLKILLDAIVADGDLTEKHRNALLVGMTDEVAALVLRDNYLQTLAITLIEAEGFPALDNHGRLMRFLERNARLDRVVEYLPDEEALAERAAKRQGLTRPEIAVLFSYSKIWLHDQILPTDLPDDHRLAEDLVRYFPGVIADRFVPRVPTHRLRRELIATSITNSLINRMGGAFVIELSEKTGAAPVDIARAYIIARDVFALRDVWDGIEALDGKVPASVQTTLHREVQRLIERAALWYLRHGGGTPLDISVNISAFDMPVAALSSRLEDVLTEETISHIRYRAGRYEADGVPAELASRVAFLMVMPSMCDIVRIAAAKGIPAEDVARIYFELGQRFGFGWLRAQTEKIVASNFWQELATTTVIEELYAHQRDATLRVLEVSEAHGLEAIEVWTRQRRSNVERTTALLAELQATSKVDLTMLTVASRTLRMLTEG